MLQVAAATGAAKAVVSAGSGVIDYFGTYDKEKDAHRQATNANAFQIAQTGGPMGQQAYAFLKARGGAGAQTIIAIPGVDGTGGIVDGWPSEPARQDARAKAKALQPKYEGAALPDPGAITGSVVPVNPLTGQPLTPAQTNVGGMLAVAAGIALVLWLVGRKGA